MDGVSVLDAIPAFSSVRDELDYLDTLMHVPFCTISEHSRQFDAIVGDVFTAHLDGLLFDVTPEDQPRFVEFADWLAKVAKETGVDATAWAYPFRVSVTGLGIFKAMPTCMEADLELRFIDRLMSLPLQTFKDDPNTFQAVLDDLVLSHRDTGLFGITPANEHQFFLFADWADGLREQLGVDYSWISETFRVSFDEMAEQFPGTRDRQ